MEGPNSPPAESPARDKYLCPVHKAEFAFLKSQSSHVRNKHPEAASSSAREKTFACDLCCNAFLNRRELLQHHEQEHGFMARRSTVQFSSIAEFQAWKENTERKEQAHFIAKRGVTRLSSGATKRTDTPWSMQHGLLHSLHSAGLRDIHQTGDHSKHILRKFCDRGSSVSHGRTFDN
ncbi:uncharacterized protein LOC144127991 [Amblyomma americanum]